MAIKSAFVICFPGYYQIKQGNHLKGILISIVFSLCFAMYVIALFSGFDGSLFMVLILSVFLFYILDVIENGLKEEKDKIVSEQPYEDGRIALMTFDYESAEKLFFQALELDPLDLDVVFQLAVLYKKKSDTSKAKIWLKKYLRQNKHKKWRDDAKKLLKEIQE
ncbi:MAG: tetratricopeptide repeat protein [Candidatus Aureabacteria bacterium]|nr:tetratricopeptide repeat protein [Candidatus Auribacterota bacterium]